MDKDYSNYTQHQVKFGSLNRHSDLLSASALSDIVNQCYIVSSLNDNRLPSISFRSNGDIAIVSGYITTDVVTSASLSTRSAYFWDKDHERWEALAGIYNLSDVYFDSNIVLTENFGHHKVDSSIGYYTLSSKGCSLLSVFKEAYQQPKHGSKTYPTFQFTLGSYAANKEVGESYKTPSAILKMTSAGSYQYGPSTGITVPENCAIISSYDDNDRIISNANELHVNSSFSLSIGNTDHVYTDSKVEYKYIAKVNYSQGAIPKNNLGEDDSDNRILSAISSYNLTASFTGQRYCFWGYKLNGDQYDITKLSSEQIRNLSSTGGYGVQIISAASPTAASNFRVPSNTKQIIIAAPHNRQTKKIHCQFTGSSDRLDFDNANERYENQVYVYGATTSTPLSGYDIWSYTAEATINATDFTIAWDN